MPLIFLVLLFAGSAWAHDGQVPIYKFRAVTAAIFAGANPVTSEDDLRGVEYLSQLGIHTVVSLQGADVDGTFSGRISNWMHHGERPGFTDVERCLVEGQGMTYVNLPIRSRRPWGEQDRRSVEEALTLLSQATPEAPLYLHCQRGIDRTGLIVALYRVHHQGWTPEAAYEEWLAVGRSRVARLVTAALDDYYCERQLLPL